MVLCVPLKVRDCFAVLFKCNSFDQLPHRPVLRNFRVLDNKAASGQLQFSSEVEFPLTFCQFLLNLDCESICDPPGCDTLLAQEIYLTDYTSARCV